MDGTIDLKSTFGEGSRMTITVPFRKAPTDEPASTTSGSSPTSSPAKPEQKSTPPRRPQDVRVLLAEDNSLISEIVCRQLRKMGVRSGLLVPPTLLVRLS